MIEVERVSLLPTEPAVYAMYGGRGPGLYIAYVGVADNLRRRAEQHLVRRSSSVTTGVAAVGLDPNNVTELRWWTDLSFSQRAMLEAAELVAFDVLDPALRSRGRVHAQAQLLYSDEESHEQLRAIFAGPPAGRLVLPTLQDALDRIAAIERRLEEMAQRLG